jgi:hypothetical protein
MAERIEALSPSARGAAPKYPWSEWTDGSAWRIVRGIDYDIPSASMAALIRQHAHRYGLSVSAVLPRGDVEAVEFQFSPRKSVAA